MASDEISGCVRGVRAPVVCDTGARTVLSGFPAGWEPPGWVTANSTSPVSRATSAASSASVRLTGSVFPTTADTPPQVDHTPKCSSIWRTAIDPSPTADATLFTEPLRTSPAANTPGWLVSSIPGWRRGRRPREEASSPWARASSARSRSSAISCSTNPGWVGTAASRSIAACASSKDLRRRRVATVLHQYGGGQGSKTDRSESG